MQAIQGRRQGGLKVWVSGHSEWHAYDCSLVQALESFGVPTSSVSSHSQFQPPVASCSSLELGPIPLTPCLVRIGYGQALWRQPLTVFKQALGAIFSLCTRIPLCFPC